MVSITLVVFFTIDPGCRKTKSFVPRIVRLFGGSSASGDFFVNRRVLESLIVAYYISGEGEDPEEMGEDVDKHGGEPDF